MYNNNLITHKNFGFFSEENNISSNLKMFIGRKLSDKQKYKCKMVNNNTEGYSCTLFSIDVSNNFRY